MIHRRKQFTRSSFILLGIVVMLGCSVSLVSAGPVTNPGGVPFAKVSLYRKLLEVLDVSGRRLEIGASGTDITGSANIVFRPTDTNGVLASPGVEVRSNGISSNIYIPGDLCLYSHPGGTISASPDCRHQISAGGGATLWRENNALDEYGASYHVLEPIPLAGNSWPGVHLGSVGTPVNSSTAIDLTTGGFANTSLVARNYGNGDAALFTGNLVTNGRVTALGRLLVGGREVWRPGGGGIPANEGELSKLVGEDYGLDADLANGNQVTIEPASSCADSDYGNTSAPAPRVACLCFSFKYAEVYGGGFYNPNSVPTARHCIDMANRF